MRVFSGDKKGNKYTRRGKFQRQFGSQQIKVGTQEDKVVMVYGPVTLRMTPAAAEGVTMMLSDAVDNANAWIKEHNAEIEQRVQQAVAADGQGDGVVVSPEGNNPEPARDD